MELKKQPEVALLDKDSLDSDVSAGMENSDEDIAVA